MEDENSLKVLTKQREYVFREIQILYDLSREVQKDKSKLSAFKARYSRIDSIRNEYLEFTQSINKILLKINPEEDIGMKSVAAFDDLYYEVLVVAESYFPRSGGVDDRGAAATEAALAQQFTYDAKPTIKARLPNIELPKFNGNIEYWQTFYDTYVSLVHDNESISPIEKFHYLISCLCDSALSIAKGVPVTADNYQIVFDSLVDRYQNKRILAATYLDKICNFPQIKPNNFYELRSYTNLLNESVNALKAMKLKDLGEFILFYLASRNLDTDTRKGFETQNQTEIPTFVELLSFLQNYVKIMEASGTIATITSGNSSAQLKSSLNKAGYRPAAESWRTHKSAALPANIKQLECFGCGLAHTIYRCPKFLGLDFNERLIFISTKNMCVNCLRPNHIESQCFSRTNCASCGARHHTLLHGDGDQSGATLGVNAANRSGITRNHHQASDIFQSNIVDVNSDHVNTVDDQSVAAENLLCQTDSAVGMCASIDPCTDDSTATVRNANVEHGRALVLLGTCTVLVRGDAPDSPPLLVRALIDSGAQDCFMTARCAKRLGLPVRRCNVTVAGLGENMVHQVKGITSCCVQPCDAINPRFQVQPIVMDKITSKMPAVEVPYSVRLACQNLKLADSDFDKSEDVDLLLGAELFHNIYDGQRIELGPGLPVALHSVFGWVVTGKVELTCRPPSTITSLFASTLALDQVVKRFWEVEEPPALNVSNPDDDKCEQIYSELTYQNPDGRYVVPILLKETHTSLGDSRNNSLSRLLNLEKRFTRDNQLKEDYSKFMREYETLGHMKCVSVIGSDNENSGQYIIPHHCVLRPESTSTKLRVVFDASAKTSSGVALNDIVYTGPKLQNDIVNIITKFRLDKVVFTADICKMYRNIDLRPEDRKLQHVLWRESPADPVREFELTTVTYGVSSSPYLAIRTLHQLATDHGKQWPRAADTLLNDTFMDDITAGASSVEAAISLKDELIHLLDAGKFELRKWSSNSREFLAQLPSDHCQVPKSFCDEGHQSVLKILGVQWDPVNDHFTYSIREFNPTCTKRAILSNVARIYDPLGWITPVVLIAKLLLQALWRHQLSWDEKVPPYYANEWQEFVSELKHLSDVRLPRLIVPSTTGQFELIGFCDGSTKAYGCCVYLRAMTDTGVNVNLLIAKSKVAPLKTLTVNRLELCGAVLLARVLKHTFNLLSEKIKLSRVFAFTDSTTVLAWLNTEPYKLKTFVSHRVVKICEDVSVENWHHVSTEDNPADYCSRGLSCSQLLECSSWWSGPSWLIKETT